MLDVNEFLSNYIQELDTNNTKKYDTTINHTRMEQLIYNEKKEKLDQLNKGFDYTISEIEDKAVDKLPSFKGLSQDLFNLFYKINPSSREDETLTNNAQKFNKHIIDKVLEDPDYGALKLITEGKDLESIEGCREFVKELYDNLDDLLKDVTGEPGILKRVDKLQEALKDKLNQLKLNNDLLSQLDKENANKGQMEGLRANIESLSNQVKGIQNQIEKFNEIMDASSRVNEEKIEKNINKAISKSLDRVNEIKDILDMWGTQDGRPQTIEGKTELISKIKNNDLFQKLAKELGKLRKLAKSSMNKRFTSGRGQRVGIEFGNKLNKVLPSELVYLANDETKALFYKKLADKKLKQYMENQELFEGRGHVIYIVDESGSTKGDRSIWAKALGIALMDIAIKDHRNFAFIPFDTRVGNVHHVNYDNYSEDIVLQIANTFLGGGTDFNEPIKLAITLLNDDRYNNADIVFVTDGHANIDFKVLQDFKEIMQNKSAKCTGILLDKGGYGYISDSTIKKFCNKVFRTSELSADTIAENVMNSII